MKVEFKTFRKLTIVIAFAMVLTIAVILGTNTQFASAESSKETDYTFETVPVESIEIFVDGGLTEIQPRQEFTLSYEVNPWYTTAKEIYFDIIPSSAATVSEVSKVKFFDGKAQGMARITVAADAIVGSTFTVFAGVDGIESNKIEMTVAKIPVTNIALSLNGTDDKLHIGKTRTVECEFFPAYASVQDVRYEMSGSGVKYIESFDEASGTITAKKGVTFIDVNSTVTITAYSVDYPNAFDSVTLTLYMPTTIVELSANTPLGRVNADGNALAVVSSLAGDTISLSAKVNGVDSTGLNYVIVKGKEYVEDGYVRSDGTFALRPTSNWSDSMKMPHPEVKIRASYSDGFDEITVSMYVPVERIAFVNTVVSNVENFRSYDMQAEAFPKYATLLADNDEPIYYSLNGIDSSIASVDGNGLLSLPKSLTSKGSIINYSANLTNTWTGVDVQPLTYDLTVSPVYAKAFESIKITKNGVALDDVNVKALPSDNLQVEVVYTIDNVTDVDVILEQDSNMITTLGSSIFVAPLSEMQSDSPFIEICVNYNQGGNVFAQNCYLLLYVPALSAEISDATFHRDNVLDLNSLIKINGHGHATNRAIEWGAPIVSYGNSEVKALCKDGLLNISTFANAGTIVKVPYRTYDSDTWQYKEFTVAALNGSFSLDFGIISSNNENEKYSINPNVPQLEEGHSVDMYLKYKGYGGKTTYGLTYSIDISTDNATLIYKSGDANQDIFTLGAKSGQSGQNNYITFKITIYDGVATYYVVTAGPSVPNNMINGFISARIAIFKRISGTLGVSNTSVEVGNRFDLTGWDPTFTIDKKDLVWSISGGRMIGTKILSAPYNNFYLTITANQEYNGQSMSCSSKIAFSSIIYRFGDSNDLNNDTAKRVYLQQGYSLTLEGEICTRTDYVQTGWSSDINGFKDYDFGEIYSGSADITLYAYWVKIITTVEIEQEITVDENQKKNSYTDYMYIDLSIEELKELGYNQISVEFSYDLQKIKQDGDCAKIWMELDGKDVYVRDKFSLSSSIVTYSDRFNLNLDEFSSNSKIRVGVFAYGDWKIGKYTFTFYKTTIKLTAIKS